ncbi:glycoside hydrolase family 92 protein [Polaribacter haliotis]|uniref:Glycoside hydrolase family 92 protein n=1 Tax=Polaribacter haliotis TaxID=1888915 RepID=A0A7L8AFU8_9FLAO|nr:glycoside hydrolase family 92 protein [Polaribacter haliotis]
MKFNFHLFFITLFLISSRNNTPEIIETKIDKNLISYVNPMIGTSKMGHVYPGATAPFGMVQLSPQTNFEVMFKDGKYNAATYEYFAGYQYRDTTIVGFAHTNFSGTGHSDLGDLLVMPTVGDLVLDPIETKEGKKATLNLENGNTLVISSENQSKENVYVSKLTINGKEINRNYILHNEIMDGGEFVFTMSNQSKK